MRRRTGFWCMVIAFCILVGCTASEADGNRIPGRVTRVVDGDTMKVELSGKEETIRLLLVDTPETVDPDRPVQPFGPEASDFAKQALTGKSVEIEIDVSERDKYGRLLAYLWVDGYMFNERLLEEGLARVAYVYPPNVRHVDRFRKVQNQARQDGIGIWSIEDYAQEDGFREQAAEVEQVLSCEEPQIKGNINSKGEYIYHLPGSPAYERTKPEAMFCTEDEAQAAGFRAVRK